MRIWDIDPGFLNDKSLLGEHVELHAIFSVIANGRRGYANHPETLRWREYLPALTLRHALLVAEMTFRGFTHRSPLPVPPEDVRWPEHYIDRPADQYRLLFTKYTGKAPGRIPLPGSAQELWARHKYSVMARSPDDYRRIGPQVAGGVLDFPTLADRLPAFLRRFPPPNRLRNSVEHMWGYVADFAGSETQEIETVGMLGRIQKLAVLHDVQYIIQSTALVELAAWTGLQSPDRETAPATA